LKECLAIEIQNTIEGQVLFKGESPATALLVSYPIAIIVLHTMTNKIF
jgi:hypothetical protein